MRKNVNLKVEAYKQCNPDQIIQVFLNAFAKGLAKLLSKTLCDGIMNKNMNK